MRMTRTCIGTLLFVALGLVGTATTARAQNALVGAWERTSLLDADGKSIQPPQAPAFLVLTADGFFAQMAVPAGRPKVDRPVDQLTREELVARFNYLEARRGTYTVSGNRLTRRDVVHSNPVQQGAEQIQLFRIEGDTLILSATTPGRRNEARFRRVK
jgi:hypothetical protein